MMEYSPIVMFDPSNKGGIMYPAWKRKTLSAIRAVPGLAKFVDQPDVKAPALDDGEVENETRLEFVTRLEKHVANKEKAVKMVHDRVVIEIYDNLQADWSPYKTLEFLDEAYGQTVAVNLAVKFDELQRLTLSSSDDPTKFINRVVSLTDAMKEICKAKKVTTADGAYDLLGILYVLRSLNIEPYKVLRETIISNDTIIDSTLVGLRTKMIGLQSSHQASSNPLGFAAQTETRNNCHKCDDRFIH